MSAADRLEDSFPHGTIDGHRAGCRDANCPAPISCRDVFRRYSGDFGFRRLIDAGVPLDEILRRDAAEHEGIEQRDKAAARAIRTGKPASTPRATVKREKPAAAAPRSITPAAAAIAPVDAWIQERDAWRARRKELYTVLRATERAIEQATTARDRAQEAFDAFVADGEPQRPETTSATRRRRPRAVIEADIRRVHAEGLDDAAAAAELGISVTHAGNIRRELQLPAHKQPRSSTRAPREPRAPRQLQGHGTNASYVRGCRCDECKAAARAYHRAWMASRRDNADSIPAEHHGTAYGYQLGCRSRKHCPSTPSCSDASLAEERRRRREAGTPAGAARVAADPVRDHVRQLMDGGMSVLAIATAADVSKSGLKTLLYGRSGERKGEYPAEIETEKAQRLLALEVSA